jgi:hypothetical protein
MKQNQQEYDLARNISRLPIEIQESKKTIHIIDQKARVARQRSIGPAINPDINPDIIPRTLKLT